ncbi:MAG: glycosyltransferase family 39 protein [Deltaproteobacteria bacterium]|nr:glycosyltransferase family 39 protein [Deltaproteobacteria bacterium]
MMNEASNKSDVFHYISLAVILILATFIRTTNLGSNPAGFFCDEADVGLQAYRILNPRPDVENWLPVFFRCPGHCRDPVPIYSTVPFVAAFGLDELTTRIPFALYGSLQVLVLYLFANCLFGNRVALFSAMFVAISPWQIQMSRMAMDAIPALFWLTFGLYMLTLGRRNVYFYAPAVLGFILAFFSYQPPKMYLPLVFAAFLGIFWPSTTRWLKSKTFWVTSLLGIGLMALLLWGYISDGSAFTRWRQVQGSDASISRIVEGYKNHFTLDFLFRLGDSQFHGQGTTRHSIRGAGELYWFQLPPLLLSIFAFWSRGYQKRPLIFVLSLLLLYPIGSIFVTTNPFASRSVLGVLPFTILSAIGADMVIRTFAARAWRFAAALSISAIAAAASTNYYQLLRDYPSYSSDYWGWQYGFRQAITLLKNKEALNIYDELRITHRFNGPDWLLDYYNVIFDCKKCISQNNPIQIDITRKQYFVMRIDDVIEAQMRYPNLKFDLDEIIFLPNGKPELWGGTFVSSD